MSFRTVVSLDLSTPRGEIAVVRDGVVVFCGSFLSERSHNAQVFAPLREALAVADADGSGGGGGGVDLIVLGTGPGSYTGVRIGIAAAQGVALSRQVPVMGWPSITAPLFLSESAGADAGSSVGGLKEFRVVGDARRGLFYVASVQAGQVVGEIRLLEAAGARALVEGGGGADAEVEADVNEAGDLAVAGSGPWVSFDGKVPFGADLAGRIALAVPSAVGLARHALGLPRDEVLRRAALPLEPVYLQDPFITTSKRAGKVPAL